MTVGWNTILLHSQVEQAKIQAFFGARTHTRVQEEAIHLFFSYPFPNSVMCVFLQHPHSPFTLLCCCVFFFFFLSFCSSSSSFSSASSTFSSSSYSLRQQRKKSGQVGRRTGGQLLSSTWRNFFSLRLLDGESLFWICKILYGRLSSLILQLPGKRPFILFPHNAIRHDFN